MNEQNPYAAPKADLGSGVSLETSAEVPSAITKKIKGAWIAGIISGTVTLVMTLAGFRGLDLTNLVDAGLIFALAFGIFRKSRFCAVALLGYFILSKILIIKETGKVDGIVMAVIFIYFYWQGVVGTFQYRKFLKEARAQEEARAGAVG